MKYMDIDQMLIPYMYMKERFYHNIWSNQSLFTYYICIKKYLFNRTINLWIDAPDYLSDVLIWQFKLGMSFMKLAFNMESWEACGGGTELSGEEALAVGNKYIDKALEIFEEVSLYWFCTHQLSRSLWIIFNLNIY